MLESISIHFEYPTWFILFCLLVGFLYSFFLYYKKSERWSKPILYFLSTLRFITVFIISFLLLSPFIKTTKNIAENPTILFVIDNSNSMEKYVSEIKNECSKLSTSILNENEIAEIKYADLNGNIFSTADSIRFTENKTDLNKSLEIIQNKFENNHLQSVVLVSDGINNYGSLPSYKTFNFQIHTIGFGDTTQKNDLKILALKYNKIVYSNSKFPIKVTLHQKDKKYSTLRIKENDKEILSKQISFENETQEILLHLESSQIGKVKYTIELDSVDNEITTKNNFKTFFIEIVNTKEKILLLSPAPHPDIKQIKNALETNPNIEFTTAFEKFPKDSNAYSSIIAFHIHEQKNKNLYTKLKNSNKPIFWIVGENSSTNQLPYTNSSRSEEFENSFIYFNSDFKNFELSEDIINSMQNFPPMKTQIIDFENDINKSNVILYQKIGSVKTNKPILYISEINGIKNAYFVGEGLWRLRLIELLKTEESIAFDALINKTIQLISNRDLKKKFKINTIKDEFLNDEQIAFEVETYNEIYERVFNKKFEIFIKGENYEKKFLFDNFSGKTIYQVGYLKEGIYNYYSTCENDTSSGSFVVQNFNLETETVIANHQLLKEIANNNMGKFQTNSNISDLLESFNYKMKKKIVFSDVSYLDLINFKWLFFILILLISLEWASRKYTGYY